MAADDYNPVSVPPFVVFNIYSGTAKVALFLSIIMKCKPCPPFNGGTTSASPILWWQGLYMYSDYSRVVLASSISLGDFSSIKEELREEDTKSDT